ncbi:MAG: hypothetical protein IT204_23065 [Fimbriimonadaceae bacterium]|nr:hypothetical protein [Fimbriimonadaceae bacterium]
MSLALLLFLFDFGKPDSPVLPEWTAVHPGTVATAEAAGWVDPPELTAQDYHYPRLVENASRGVSEPPPVYTDELTRDAVGGTRPARFRVPLLPGDYNLWAVAGSSVAVGGALYDFTLSVGGASTHFQMAGSRWFESRRLKFHATGPIDLLITPRSRWILSGLAIWEARQSEAVEPKLAKLEQAWRFLPDDVLAKWKQVPRRDPVAPPGFQGQPWEPLGQLSAADQRRGYLVHQRHWSENIYPDTIPYSAELNPTLRAFASLGEAEPLTFAVLPLRPLRGATVKVSDLTGPGTIPASRIDLKMVEYAWSRPNYSLLGSYLRVPDYLRPVAPQDLPAAENKRYWLTVTVPEDAPAGLYRGTATFSAAGAPAATVPIEFRVLPIRLQQNPDRVYGIYYRDPLDDAARATDPAAKEYYTQQAELQARDMVAHGTTPCVPLTAYCSVPSKPDQPITWACDWDLLTRKIDRCRRYGYQGPLVMHINTNGLYARHMGGKYPGSHLRGVQVCPPAFETELQAMVSYLEAGRQERGLPEFLYYPVDEPGTAPEQVAFMVQCLKAIRAAGARTYVTADPTHEQFEPMRPYINVWCTQPFLPDRETVAKDSAASGVEYWCYPNHINGENDHTTVLGARMTYGFGFWRSGFKVLIPWIYSSTGGHPFNNLDSSTADFFNRPGPDGTVWPVPMWEAYREGYDDYRYVYTLQQAIARHPITRQPSKADRAQSVLAAVEQAIEVKAKYKLDADCWGYREFDVYRWQLAEQILALSQRG